MKRAFVWILGAGLLLSAAPAFADPDPDAPAALDPNAPPPAVTAPAAVGAFPVAIDDRPLVLPMGKFEIHAALNILGYQTVTVSGMPPVAMTSSAAAEALSLGGSYGIADKVEVGADYVAELNPSGSGVLGLRGAFGAYKSGPLEIALAGDLVFNLQDSNSVGLELGAWVRYHVAPKVSIFTGNPGLPASLGGISTFAAPPEGYQLSLGFNNNGAIGLDLPVGVGLQATPNVYAFLATDIAHFGFSNSSNAFLFADFIPLGIGAFYSMPQLDIGITFADDLKDAGDFYVINLVGRFFIK
jgi:hypothetical protein